jgi:VanZ family protein
VVLYAAAIFTVSDRPRSELPTLGRWDFPVHFAEYAVLGCLVRRLVRRCGWGSPGRQLWLAAALGSLYGFTDEAHQSLVPGREVGVSDLVADAAGSLAGALLYGWLARGEPGRVRFVQRKDDKKVDRDPKPDGNRFR